MRYEFSLYCESVPARVVRWIRMYAVRYEDCLSLKTALICQEYASDFVAVLVESGVPFSCHQDDGFRSSGPCRNANIWTGEYSEVV